MTDALTHLQRLEAESIFNEALGPLDDLESYDRIAARLA